MRSIIKRALKVYNFIPFCIKLYTFNDRTISKQKNKSFLDDLIAYINNLDKIITNCQILFLTLDLD